MVNSVTAVSGVYKTRRDERRVPASQYGKKNAEGLFAKILEENIKETGSNAVDCCTVTYGRDCKMQTFLYQTREYRH